MNGLSKIFAGVGFALGHVIAAAQAYPDRPIRVLLPTLPGGTVDVLARTVLPTMSDLLGQQIVVDNRGGAGGRIAAELAARAAPDGYTLLVSSPGTLTVVPQIVKNVGYDTLKDFAAVGLVSVGSFLLVTHPSVGAKTVKELIALARSQPGKLNYASAGNGTPNHLGMELFKAVTSADLTHVPYKGASLAVIDLVAGRVGVMLSSIPPVLAHVQAGRMQALGIAGAKRSGLLPNVPTIDEAGVPGFESGSWLGVLAPAQTPPRIIDRLNAVMVQAVATSSVRAKLEGLGADPVGSTPEALAQRIRREWDQNAKLVKMAGMRAD